VQSQRGAALIAAPRVHLTASEWRQLRTAAPFVLPWVIGFFAFTLYPIIYSLYLSFQSYSGFGDAVPVGFASGSVAVFGEDGMFLGTGEVDASGTLQPKRLLALR